MNEAAGTKTVLITGGAGFFGSLLKQRLLDDGFQCVSIDLEPDDYSHPNLFSIRGDIRETATLDEIFSDYQFDAIFHCAAALAHAVKNKEALWSCNVVGTKNIADYARRNNTQKIIFTSSNCLWGEDLSRPIKETDKPKPVEIYGRSKWEAEKILLEYADDLDVIILRCPTIVDYGRLGLLAILFEFIDEGRKVWVVGGGDNKYQFIYAQDLIDACRKALDYRGSDIFNVGSDDVKSFREIYEYVIDNANTKARVASLPKRTTLLFMKIAYYLRLSTLGPYQYKMISSNFVFDTSKIKEKLDWRPTLTNEEMLNEAYKYYRENLEDIKKRKDVSAHKQVAEMGIIKLLKWLS